MLLRAERSDDWLVSVTRNSEPELMASSRMECEIVSSSNNGVPLDLRPAASLSLAPSSHRNT